MHAAEVLDREGALRSVVAQDDTLDVPGQVPHLIATLYVAMLS